MNKIVTVALVLVVVAFGVAGNADVENEKAEVSQYCEMVKLGIDSNGEYGWPDYDDKYKTECL